MLAIPSTQLGEGLANPVRDAQVSFRSLLSAMSEPGTIETLGSLLSVPQGLSPAAAIAILTLADQETPIWLAPRLGEAAAGYLRFHTGAPLTDVPAAARFAVLDSEDVSPSISAFDGGDDRYPDRSATVIVQCAAVTGGMPVTLRGPGIRGSRRVAPAGLSASFWNDVSINNARYPLGVDILLAAGREIIAIPRSASISKSVERC